MNPINFIKVPGVLIALAALGFTTQASAAVGDLILNEWNAVGPSKWLEGGNCDPAFSSCPMVTPSDFDDAEGNGGDWIELVVVADEANLEGYTIEWQNDDGFGKFGTLTFTALWDVGALADLPAGTIITIRDDGDPNPTSATDLTVSRNDCDGDWTIEIDADDTRYITQGGGATCSYPFQTDNDGWRAAIYDGASNLVQDFVGESSCTFCTGSGINSEEVGKLEEDPSAAAATGSPNYQDGNASTYGEANRWDTTNVQCFDDLRSNATNETCSDSC